MPAPPSGSPPARRPRRLRRGRSRVTSGPLRCPLCHDALRTPDLSVDHCPSCRTPYHQTCLKELAGCATLGCERHGSSPSGSEGGRDKSLAGARVAAHDPARTAGTEPDEPPRIFQLFGFGGSLFASWLCVPIFWPLGLLFIGVSAPWLWLRGRTRLASWLVALAPFVLLPVFNGLFATAGYWSGSATLRGRGLPGYSYANLDPVLRCKRRSSGCIVDGSEVLTQAPHNLVLRGWGALFGPMRGAYTGPLPSLEEAQALIRSQGREVRLRDLEESLEQADQLTLSYASDLRDFELYDRRPAPLRRMVLEERCLVLSRSGLILVVDLKSGERLARWRFEPPTGDPTSPR